MPEVVASAVISGDGLLVESVFELSLDSDLCSAMCAALLALAERASAETRRGDMQMVMVQGDSGVLLLLRTPGEHVLAAVVNASANLGMTLNQVKKAAASLSKEIMKVHVTDDPN